MGVGGVGRQHELCQLQKQKIKPKTARNSWAIRNAKSPRGYRFLTGPGKGQGGVQTDSDPKRGLQDRVPGGLMPYLIHTPGTSKRSGAWHEQEGQHLWQCGV